MNDDVNYPRFIEQADLWMQANPERRISYESLLKADERLHRINQLYYRERDEAETDKERRDAQIIHTLRMQEFFEDTFGDDAWDERHEIYTDIQG